MPHRLLDLLMVATFVSLATMFGGPTEPEEYSYPQIELRLNEEETRRLRSAGRRHWEFHPAKNLYR